MKNYLKLSFLSIFILFNLNIHSQEIDSALIKQIADGQVSFLDNGYASSMMPKNTMPFDDINVTEETLVEDKDIELDNKWEVKKFGYDFFTSVPSTVLAVGDLPLPSDYKIALKDNFTIILSGSKDSIFDVDVQLDGSIFFPEIGSVYVAGITLEEVRTKLKNLVDQRFIGVEIDISLNSLSGRKINIVGAVNNPGTYLVNPFTTLTSALNYSGGIKENGSLRNIKLIKSNGEIYNYDLYDFLIFGSRSGDLPLDAGDTILIQGTDNFVEIEGSVMRPMIYEVTENDKLGDLIEYALGFKRNSNKSKISVSFLDSKELKINQKVTADLDFNVNDALKVSVFDYVTDNKQGILVKGAVQESGYYDYKKYSSLKDLIADLKFVNTYPFFSIIEQFDKDNYKQQTTFFSLNDPSTYQYVKLSPNTKIYFISLDEFENFSSKFILDDGIEDVDANTEDDINNLEDKIDLSLISEKKDLEEKQEDLDNFKKLYDINDRTYKLMTDYELTINHDENIYKIPVYGKFTVSSIADLIGLDLSDVPDYEATYISPIDNIVEVSDYRLMSFEANKFHNLSFKTSQNSLIKANIYGAVEFPGQYTLSENSTLQDLYNLVGSFKDYANPNAIIFRRESIKQQQVKSILRTKSELKSALLATSIQSDDENINSSILEDLNAEIDENSLGRIAGNFSPNSIQSIKTILENGDTIFVPKFSNTISVVGEVMNPNAFVYESNITFKDAVDLAGGYKDSADKRGAYIIKENGLISKPGANIFLVSQDIKAGDTIVIPTKVLAANSTLDYINSLTAILSQISFSAAAIDSLRTK